MAKYIVKPGQNLYDIATHLYGSIEGLFDLLISNKLSMDTELRPGMELEYHDFYMINQGIVDTINNNNYLPANSERHVYYKNSAYDLLAFAVVDPQQKGCVLEISGNGIMEIDWGDNSDLEIIHLSSKDRVVEHYFDNIVEERRIKIYGDCEIMRINTSKFQADIYALKPIVIDEYVSHKNKNSITWLLLSKGTILVDLRGMEIDDLSPIYDMSLQELDLRDVKFTKDSILDDYLEHIAGNYGRRRNCTVYLTTEPTERGMDAIQTIINEESWNEAGPWKFIINDVIYTYNGENIN